jgi:hypothetical protein
LTERSDAAHADTENDHPGGADIVAPPREPANPAPWMAKAENWLRRRKRSFGARVAQKSFPLSREVMRLLLNHRQSDLKASRFRFSTSIGG